MATDRNSFLNLVGTSESVGKSGFVYLVKELKVNVQGLIEAKVVQRWIVHSRRTFRGLCIECFIQTLQIALKPWLVAQLVKNLSAM